MMAAKSSYHANRCILHLVLLSHCYHIFTLGLAPPTPIDSSAWPDKFPAKRHCSKCGLCETSYVSHVTGKNHTAKRFDSQPI